MTRLGTEVTRVDWEEGRVTTSTGEMIVGYYMAMALTFFRKVVICTVSLGVLKEQHNSLFHPTLPQQKVDTINKLGFGTMNKIYLEFESVFWDQVNFLRFMGQIIGLQDKPGIQLIDPDQHEGEEGSWVEEIAGFDVAVGEERTLCGWVVGETARLVESLPEEQVKVFSIPPIGRWLASAWRGCGGSWAHRCLLLWRAESPAGEGTLASEVRGGWGRWPGSYSYCTVACDEAALGPLTLATPLKVEHLLKDVCPLQTFLQDKLLFGGEATDIGHYGTVTGAMLVREGWLSFYYIIQVHKNGLSPGWTKGGGQGGCYSTQG